MQILIRWLDQKPADLDLHCFLTRFRQTMNKKRKHRFLVFKYFYIIFFFVCLLGGGGLFKRKKKKCHLYVTKITEQHYYFRDSYTTCATCQNIMQISPNLNNPCTTEACDKFTVPYSLQAPVSGERQKTVTLMRPTIVRSCEKALIA